MTGRPTVDGRTQESILEEVTELADAYTDGWSSDERDNAWAILRIFAQLSRDVLRRLNGVPEKHQVAFLDALDFDRRPPKAARTPLTFSVSADLGRNVTIPGGTQARATTGAGERQTFEIPANSGFEATGASLRTVLAVDPAEDAIVEHDGLCTDEQAVSLFTGDDRQEHTLYLGTEDILNLDAGASVTITAETDDDTDLFGEDMIWEYYGTVDGQRGWHTLEQPPAQEDTDEGTGLDALRASVDARTTSSQRADDDSGQIAFRIGGSTTMETVDGVESHWLRCRLAGDIEQYVGTSIDSLAVSVGSPSEDGLDPDSMLANDVPLSTDADGDIHPFGRHPQPPATFYVAAEEAFTKRNGIVELRFGTPAGERAVGDLAEPANENGESRGEFGVVGGPPLVSWEYYNGEGWTRIDGLTDETAALRTAGDVRFPVPEDIERTAVSGHENVWVRARLVSGNYGQPSFEVTAEGDRGAQMSGPEPPAFGDVSVHYDREDQPFETVMRYEEGTHSENLAGSKSLAPFTSLDEQTQTLYLGFDETLRDGPLSLFVPIEDATYPPSFDPAIQWEYCSDPEREVWSSLDGQDRTAGLTERGIVSLQFPEPTVSVELFGETRHWIRARITQDEFTHGDGGSTVGDQTNERSTTERTTTPPTITGIYPNTQWAYNTQTIDDEILGSSDGAHEQTFQCAHAPVIDAELWVDEGSALSASERRRLAETSPERIERETDVKGNIERFWVRWESVPDLLDAGPTDRQYVIDNGSGTVTFGDGENGAIPPSGTDNVRATYRTGGGRDGNVDADTVTELESAISLVESVSNPVEADGGADIESMDALQTRATNRLRHRGRVVTESDYEDVALASVRELARASCEPALDSADNASITVLVVPEAEREQPMPSIELRQRVEAVLTERAPATLQQGADGGITVRGPNYAPVAVDVTVRAPAIQSVSELKRRIDRRLQQYLHPLDGNSGGGWSFGSRPSRAAIAECVGDVDGVTELLDVDGSITYNGDRRRLNNHDQRTTAVPPDTLVCSGAHSITVRTTNDTDDRRSGQ